MKRGKSSREPDTGRARPDPGKQRLPAGRKGWAAGNTATNELLKEHSEGKRLNPSLQSKLEQAYGVPLGGVRIHQDTTAGRAADTLGARAFTQGEDIALSPSAPAPDSPAGEALLAHEVAHVVQQRRASSIEPDKISQPQDTSEIAANAAAHDALAGRASSIAGSAAVPAVQAQYAAGMLTSIQVAAILTTYLERVLETQGGKALQITPDVQRAVMTIFADEPLTQGMVIEWMKGTLVPSTPKAFAEQVMKFRKTLIPEKQVKHLQILPDRPGRAERLINLAKGTAPYETPEAQMAKWEFEREASRVREKENAVGPYGVDVLRVGRILEGLGEAWRGPKKEKPAEVETKTPASVETAIKSVSPTALVPPGVKGDPGQWADGQEVARHLAAQFEIAHNAKKESIDLRLGDNYGAGLTKDQQDTVLEAVLEIARKIREAFPHRAAGVHIVNVQFGRQRISNLELNITKK